MLVSYIFFKFQIGVKTMTWRQKNYQYSQSMTVYFYHLTYAFRVSLHSWGCLNAKELIARNRRGIWRLSDCNRTRTHNHLLRKQTLNHLVKLDSSAKWLSDCLRAKCFWVQVPLQSLNFQNMLSIVLSKCILKARLIGS